MANPGYVRSTDGSNADNGSTWALANLDLSGSTADAAAGDRIFVSDNHAESTAASVTLTFPGTLASPNQILCGDDAAAPPTSLATTGTCTTTGNNGWTLNGCFYMYGLTMTAGSGAAGSSAHIQQGNTANDLQVYEAMNFILGTSSTAPRIRPTGGSGASNDRVEWINCGVRFGNASQAIEPLRGSWDWRGGSLLSGGTSPTTLVVPATANAFNPIVTITGIDLVNASAGINIFTAGQPGVYRIRNSKLPASWSGALTTGTIVQGAFFEMRNCAAGDVNYAIWFESYGGSVRHETTLVKTGGASDGTTTISWKFVSAANAEYPTVLLRSPEISKWNETTGSAVTLTVDILHDNATDLTDAEVWLEVEYLGTSGFPLSLFVDDAKADVLATAANQATSTATWTTTGMSNPNEQKLSVTFTPQEKGLFIARVCVAKASYTLYVDPEIQVS